MTSPANPGLNCFSPDILFTCLEGHLKIIIFGNGVTLSNKVIIIIIIIIIIIPIILLPY